MFKNTLNHLVCPNCDSALTCTGGSPTEDLLHGEVKCSGCKKIYPILAGLLILVPDVEDYLLTHVKGISRYVTDSEIPVGFRKKFLAAKSEIESEHIEEDLEAERVTALYVMTHYLSAKEVQSPSPAIQKLIQEYWDHGPFAEIKKWLAGLSTNKSLIELGCGTGGLLPALQGHLKEYLGLDQSFSSLVLARHLALGAKLPHSISIPYDLLKGPTTKKISPILKTPDFAADFVVCDLNAPPLREKNWDLCAALNVIDMLPEPESLPKLQSRLLGKGGTAIESSPYIWHPEVATHLKHLTQTKTSEEAITKLYTEQGFQIEKEVRHVPWVFYKNYRQIELYSAHLIFAKKP